ncbi:MAG: glycine cleavage system protein H [Deltaproteobacteria bacterium]|nr:glycine cleavage system protein H [Deltaproteobacteria bacterium]
MKEGRCPFLETTTVSYCKAFPVKMIPADGASSAKGVCDSPGHVDCTLYVERSAPSEGVESVRGFLLKSDVYLHPRHVWVAVDDASEGAARVGIDDFAQKLIGPVHRVTAPAEGAPVKENAVCFLLHSGGRTVKMVSPLDGTVLEVNRGLSSSPSLVNREPYGGGWILSLRMSEEGLRGLFYGNSARRWMAWEVERLQRAFSSDLGLTATDGGESLPDISGRLSDAQWGRIVRQFVG